MTISEREADQPRCYAICIRGHIDPRRAAWFEGLAITPLENGETVLSGPIADQAALHGLLGRIRDLNLTLIAVAPFEATGPGGEQAAGLEHTGTPCMRVQK